MTEAVPLRTDGPHSPEYTKQVADTLAECVRVLNYASLGDAPGLEYPGDVYSLLGALYTATQRLPQLLVQLAGFLDAQARTGRLADDQGREVSEQIGSAAYWLGAAHQCAGDLTAALQSAQNAIAGLFVKEDEGG